jgi:hypothetical protein
VYAAAERQRTRRHHSSARQPFEATWVTACSAIASGTGISASSTPTRTSPPAMPKMPDRKEVPTIVAHRRTSVSSGVVIGGSPPSRMRPLRVRRKPD